MKNRIIVKRVTKEIKENEITKEVEFLNFYLKNSYGEFWLFQQPFSKGVYEWFKDGRAESEIMRFAKWNRNKRLDDTIARIPREIKYVQRYVIEEEYVA